MAKQQVTKVNWWHQRLADWMLTNPDKNIKDAAVVFDCHVQTLYIIKNSDSFRLYFQQRSNEMTEGMTGEMIGAFCELPEKLAGLADMTLDALSARVATSARDMPTQELTSLADLTLKRLGYGAAKAGDTNVTVNNLSVPAEAVARARARMEQAAAPLRLEAKPPVEEGGLP